MRGVGASTGKSGLGAQVFRGVSWLALAKGINRGFVFLTTLILARLLSPTDFGLVASAVVVLNFLTLFNESGLGTAIAQSKQLEEDDLSSIFWPNLILGGLLFIGAVLLSQSASRFFNNEAIRPVLIFLAFSLVLDSFGLVQAGFLARKMDFRSLSLREMFSSLGYGISAIGGAFLGWGVWALVVGYLVKSLVGAITLWFSVSWRPSFTFDFKVFRRIYAFGLKIVGNGVVEFFRRNTDRGLIGRVLGTSSLGVYSIAYNLIMMPRDQVTPLVTRVLLPAYSKIQDDDARLEAAYLRAAQYVSLITVPVVFGLAAVAPECIKVLFGEKWLGAVAPLQYLAVAGALLSVNPVFGYVLVAKGRPGIFVIWNFIRTSITVVFLYIGLALAGLKGVAAAFSLAVVLDTPITQYISIRPVKGSMRALWAAIAPVFGATFLMVAAVTALRIRLLSLAMPELSILMTSILLGMISYFVVLGLFRFDPLFDLASRGLRFVRRYTKGR